MKWQLRTGWIDGGIAIDNNGILYYGSNDFYLNAAYPNGTIKWRYHSGDYNEATPAIGDDGTIYFASWNGNLYAFAPNGTVKWSHGCGSTISYGSPAIAPDGTIYVTTMDPKNLLVAVNHDGTEKWRYQTGQWMTSAPAIGSDGTVFFGSTDTYIYAVNPNGTLRWRYKTGDYVMGSASIAADGTVYIASWDDYLYALAPINGSLVWRCRIGSGSKVNPSIGSDGTIYIGGKDLYAILPNGTLRWTFVLDSNSVDTWSSPAISADGIIYFGTNIGDAGGGDIIAVNPNGTERWRQRIAKNWVDSSPTIGEDGTVYIGCAYVGGNGYLYAFGRGPLNAEADGPIYGLINQPVQFTGSATGGYQPYSWLWNFGDGHTSEEQNSTHTYTSPGNYTVTLTVTDNTGNTSTDSAWAWIQETNTPPDIPTITGQEKGKHGVSYDYSFVSSDPDGTPVWYYIEWGDGTNSGWKGPYASGYEITVSHTWDKRGTYNLQAKAKDGYDAESGWGKLKVTMPLSYEPPHFRFIDWLFERFPNTFPILRLLFNQYLIDF